MYSYDNAIDCMIGDEHLKSCDDDGFCNACGYQDDQVNVNATNESDITNDFTGVVVGIKEDGAIISVRDQDDNVWDVDRKSVELA